MRPAAHGREAAAYGYVAIVLLSVAAALQAPDSLAGGNGRSWLYIGYFVGAVWASSLLIASAWRLALTLTGCALAFAIVTGLAINQFGLKEAAAALAYRNAKNIVAEGEPTGIPEMMAFLASALILTWAILVRRAGKEPDASAVAKSLLIALGSLAVATMLYGALINRFLSPLNLTFQIYLMPLMASAIAVLVWTYVRRMTWRPKSPDA